MSTILITGGTGFIGQRVAGMLREQGFTPRILDLREGADVAGDITQTGVVESAAEGCEGIVHLAGLMTLACARDPLLAAEVNLTGSIHVFEAAKRGLKVAWLSSAGVFGTDPAHPRPMTVYGALKLAVEGIARAYHADHGVPSVALRPYIVYGPGESSGIAAGPSIALRASVLREPATIRFSGQVGFVFVDDVARALTAAVIGPMTGAAALTMNGDTAGMGDFVAELRGQSGWDGITVEGPALTIPPDLRSDPMPDWLGPQPVTPMHEGIARTLRELRG